MILFTGGVCSKFCSNFSGGVCSKFCSNFLGGRGWGKVKEGRLRGEVKGHANVGGGLREEVKGGG